MDRLDGVCPVASEGVRLATGRMLVSTRLISLGSRTRGKPRGRRASGVHRQARKGVSVLDVLEDSYCGSGTD